MDEDAELLFPDLPSSSTGASQQVLQDGSLNPSLPDRSGSDVDPPLQYDQRGGPGTNMVHFQEYNLVPQTADVSENAIRHQGGQETFSDLGFRLDSLGTPMNITPGAGHGILTPTNDDVDAISDGQGHDYFKRVTFAQATVDPRNLIMESPEQALVVGPIYGGTVPPTGLNQQSSLLESEPSNMPTRFAEGQEGQTAEQQISSNGQFDEFVFTPVGKYAA